MAPITEQHVDSLKDHIHKLESRIYELEQRMAGGGSSSKDSKSEAMRLILIGPPGAGKFYEIAMALTSLY